MHQPTSTKSLAFWSQYQFMCVCVFLRTWRSLNIPQNPSKSRIKYFHLSSSPPRSPSKIQPFSSTSSHHSVLPKYQKISSVSAHIINIPHSIVPVRVQKELVESFDHNGVRAIARDEVEFFFFVSKNQSLHVSRFFTKVGMSFCLFLDALGSSV